MTTTYPGAALAPADEAPPTNWGLLISTLSIPALAIPSALGINRFLSDGQDWTTGGVIAAAGFEGLNIGLSILDIKRPDLRETASRVRFWSVATAITMNVLEHYRARTGGFETFDLMALILALVASVPIAVLYVSMAGLIHGVKEHEAETADVATRLQADLEATRTKAREAEQRARTAESQASAATDEATRLRAERDGATAEARLLREQLDAATAEARAATADRDRAVELARAATADRDGATELTRKLTEAERAATAAARKAADDARQISELRTELAAAAALPTRTRVATRLKAELARMSVAELARATEWKESTLRDWIAAA